MSTIYQKLLHQWATLAPDECQATERDYRFKVRILPQVEECFYSHPWRYINSEDLILRQLNFLLLTIINHCAARQSSIGFTFTELWTTAIICNGLKSQPQLHPAIAALDAYIQLLEF
ncbi:hypothetical protein [Nostoc sp. FACHB-190]|uniref:hypothetical protein n=1 Tax=Nostoc sp. FACHB-190 TaxID=2692838 RepID=UPI0016851FBD|nr:hypothetical protein [Nostoc sp. FACHB-190]MBD2303467.1 hypothetical protein [Nostoc sp. FACHB-190]